MPEFNTSLLREKFIIRDAMPSTTMDREPVIALSNRLVLPLIAANGELVETYVIRAQNMHSCARMAAQIERDFQENGTFIGRVPAFDWKDAWLSVTKGYEKNWNPQKWVAVYSKGRIIFEDGDAPRHAFLDIIEQCDARNKGDYSKAVDVAQDAFKHAGRFVTIEHDSNIALVMTITPEEGKCGIIVRGPNRTTTFNIMAKKKADRMVKASQCLTAAAAFLDGIQMAFMIGMTQQKIEYELIAAGSPEAKKMADAGQKLGRLNEAISQFENLLEVTYRPERPNFAEMIDDAKAFARKTLASEIEKQIRGEKSAGEWGG